MTPSWYDVLDVDASASATEIRDAWKVAIADLDPSDRRFRLLNQAAETLLDPERRAAHDTALAAQAGDEGEDEDEPVGVTAPSAVVLDKDASPEPAALAEPATTSSRQWWQPPVWLVAVVGLLAVALAVVAFVQFRNPSDTTVAADTRGAQTSAERASAAVLSYDYRDLDANQTAASAYLTPSFRADYDKLFSLIKENAASVKPIVSTQVIASGIQRANAKGDRVSVLVFVNRPTINAKTTTPKVYQDQVLMQMQKVDGEWLVDDMVTSPATQ